VKIRFRPSGGARTAYLRRGVRDCKIALTPGEFPVGAAIMLWIFWALMLIGHGAFVRWAQTSRGYAKVAVLGDVLLIAIALITIDQLQGMSLVDLLRTGAFFVAFGAAGRQLMGSALGASLRSGD
jgi:hypothetical protein